MSSPPAFNARAEARRLMRTSRYATLATLDRRTAGPYASLVSTATDVDGTPIVLISRLALHTLNLEERAASSILFAEVGGGDPLVHPRVSVTTRGERTDDERVRRRFLARHPAAEMYAGFADFSFWRLVPEGGHLVAGFGRIVDLAATDLLVDLTGAEGLLEAEAEAVAHVNEDHPDTVSLYATRLLGEAAGPWRMTGIDPEGCDLACEDRFARLIFPERVEGPAGLRKAFQAMAETARTLQ
ncbi:HugZ family pyridoxamine 5'-phosphate oxidase [Alsobacter sp. R-9]